MPLPGYRQITARFHLEGERGTAVATIIVDDDGRWFGASLKRRVAEGIANIVLQCPWNEDRATMTALYDDLLHLDRWDVPQLVFDEGRPDDPAGAETGARRVLFRDCAGRRGP